MTTTSQPATKPPGTAQRGFGTTLRIDRWSLEPMLTGGVFTAFIVYSLVSALLLTPGVLGVEYESQGYISPFFSPLLLQGVLPWFFSPAILILWIPLGFRTTCYYYRKAYYRAFFFDPPGCAVGEIGIHRRYKMETAFPFILQNLHRFFLYLAFVPLFFLWLDILFSLRFEDQWRIGLGTVILGVNTFLLTMYSLSCHSMRHIVGGRLDCFSRTPVARTRYALWKKFTGFNGRHARWAWASLLSVAFTDLYIRLLAVGAIGDPAFRI
ncbi:MAG: succinate dehydrogenase [Candidatus Limnocylindrales bacterium]